MDTVIFALRVLYGPLCEYVTSLGIPVVWVNAYTKEACVNFLCEHVVFLQRGPEVGFFNWLTENGDRKVSILNTEQMSRFVAQSKGEEVQFPFAQFLMRFIENPGLFSIIDYSMANIAIWQRCFPLLRVELKCFLVNKKQQYQRRRISSRVVFVGDANSEHRQSVLRTVKQLQLLPFGCYGPWRDQLLYNNGILLNVHFGTSYSVFEEIRCLPCVLQQMIVISEISDLDDKHPLFPFIIFAEHEDLQKVVQETQANFAQIHNKIFGEQRTKFDSLCEDICLYEKGQNQLLLQ